MSTSCQFTTMLPGSICYQEKQQVSRIAPEFYFDARKM